MSDEVTPLVDVQRVGVSPLAVAVSKSVGANYFLLYPWGEGAFIVVPMNAAHSKFIAH